VWLPPSRPSADCLRFTDIQPPESSGGFLLIVTPSIQQSWLTDYFQGRRLQAEISLLAHGFSSPSLDLESELQVLHRSFGFGHHHSDREHDDSATAPLRRAIQSFTDAYASSPQDSASWTTKICQYPFAPDLYLLYVLWRVESNSTSAPAKARRLALSSLVFLQRQFPSRLDLQIALISRLGFLDLLKGRLSSALPVSCFYSDPQPAITMLTGLWINGLYAQIFHSYCQQQLHPRFFPASDFIIRVFSILGLDHQAASIFRRIFYSQSHLLPSVTLSNILFCELGFESIDWPYVQDVISRFRSSRPNPTAPSRSLHPQACQQISIHERPVLAVLSADLRNHPVGRFWLPMARQLHKDFRLVHLAYHQHEEDSLRCAFRSCSTEWFGLDHGEDPTHHLANLSPTLLLDLGGHTADNCPGVLNDRHAPVQASYLGFYGPNFGAHCDWWILDQSTARYVSNSYPLSEAVWHLQGPSLCYDVDLHGLPSVDKLVFTEKQSPTYGCFNHTRKITPACINHLASVLSCTAGSVLLVRSHSFFDPNVRRFFLRQFTEAGVGPEQIRVLPYATSSGDAMRDYCQVNIHLDSFPVCGTTTTLDSLAMGTPVLTSPTQLYAGAITAAILEQLGFEDWICHGTKEMLAKSDRIYQTYRHPHQRLDLARQVRSSALFDTHSTPLAFSHSLRQMIQATLS